jgi:gas vesicle protein
MNNAGRVLLGFVAGAAAGAIAGVLMAPDSGDNTRKKIADKSDKFKDDFNTKMQEGIDKVNTLTDSAFNLINNYKEKLEQQAKNNIPVQNENNNY